MDLLKVNQGKTSCQSKYIIMNKWSDLIFLGVLCVIILGHVQCNQKLLECYETEELVGGLYNPLAVTFADKNSMLIAEQRGTIRKLDFQTSQLTEFLDITDQVLTTSAPMDERGLLGLTLDPHFKNNGYFYVFYSTTHQDDGTGNKFDHDSLVSRFQAQKDENGNWNYGTKNSEVEIIRINQPGPRQNGGQVFFAMGGNLFITTGDGGDRQNKRFQKNSLLGKILRINVKNATKKNPYKIPFDNPFITEQETHPEIFAYGFRNPWRCTLDRQGINLPERILCGDLGEPERNIEDLNLIYPGGRYGWLDDLNASCHTIVECQKETDLPSTDHLPIHSYKHNEGQAIIGGIVYRGNKFKHLRGYYIFGDYVHGTFHTLLECDKKWIPHNLCIKFPDVEQTRAERNAPNKKIRHVLGIEKMGSEDIIILTNTAMVNDQPTGQIFKLKVILPQSPHDNGCGTTAPHYISLIFCFTHVAFKFV